MEFKKMDLKRNWLYAVIVLALFGSATLFAQQRDVIHLKNGSVVRGIITEQVPGVSFKIETGDGSIFVYSADEVERITKEAAPTPPAQTQTQAQQSIAGSSDDDYGDFVYVGGKVGYNLANITRNRDASSIGGLNLGAILEYRLNKDVGFSAELFYSQQGATVTVGSGNQAVHYDILLNYINVPAMVNLHLGSLVAKVGIQLGFLMAADEWIEWPGGSSEREDIRKDCNAMDFSIPLGVGLNLKNGLRLDIRYTYGLSDIFKRLSDWDSFGNQMISFTIGYVFPIKVQ